MTNADMAWREAVTGLLSDVLMGAFLSGATMAESLVLLNQRFEDLRREHEREAGRAGSEHGG
jgi:hypothetical protein